MFEICQFPSWTRERRADLHEGENILIPMKFGSEPPLFTSEFDIFVFTGNIVDGVRSFMVFFI
jgi:hypothetical protein